MLTGSPLLVFKSSHPVAHQAECIRVCGSLHFTLQRTPVEKQTMQTGRALTAPKTEGMMGTYKLPLLGRLSSF